MDLDFLDELLYEGCLLETTDEFNFSQAGPPTFSDQNDPSQCFPSMEPSNDHLSINPRQEVYQEVTGKNFPGSPPLNIPKAEKNATTGSQNRNAVETTISSVQSEIFPVESSESSRTWWIAPMSNPGPSSSVKERLKHAIIWLRERMKDRNVLIQIWVPINTGGKHVLTTIDQPYFLNPNCESLASYRKVSKAFHFPAEQDSKESIGFPGRVFLRKLPEWTPDVRFFRSDEYPRRDHAKQYNISGSLAVPVFERDSWTCLGVVEVIMTTRKIDYRPELENVCKALEAVDLRSLQDFCPPSVKACKEFCQAAVPEITEILGSVCKMHRLPLALTWAPCFQQGKGACQHFDENYASCISTVDSACFVADSDLLRFHVACSEQYLFIGQGIVGRAFTTNKQCFVSDVTAFSKTDYPFSHHAMMFGLRAAIAIPLQTFYSGSVDVVLELFLPRDCQDTKEQNRMRNLLPIAIQQACQSFHVVMDKELEEDINSQTVVASGGRLDTEETQQFVYSPLKEPSLQASSWIAQMMEAQQKGKGGHVFWNYPKEEPKEEFKVTTHWDNAWDGVQHKQVFTELGLGQLQRTSGTKSNIEVGKDCSSAVHHSLGSRKAVEKRRTKTEKTISLQVLRQYFAGSLKDAAKSIGVCPTTLKRICRQHGITRWPSRKIKKVGHSLKKLQLVIDSVQGAEGTIPIGSFYTTFPELTSPNCSGDGIFPPVKINDDSRQLSPQPENGIVNAGAPASKSLSSSCSQSSGSSIWFSTGTKQHITTINASSSGEALTVEDPGVVIKRTCSEVELHALNREEPKLLLRSQSHKTFGNHPGLQTLPPFPKSTDQSLQDEGTFKVKATFGEDKIRFSLQPNWGFRDLQQEIAKRFNINDICKIDLKYLDDDHEWVLLTCDADLEECKDIHRLSQGHSIKISLH